MILLQKNQPQRLYPVVPPVILLPTRAAVGEHPNLMPNAQRAKAPTQTIAWESSNATNPVIFEPMVMSTLLFHRKRIGDLEKKLNGNKPVLRILEPENAQEN